MKAKLQSDEPVYGVSVMIPSPQLLNEYTRRSNAETLVCLQLEDRQALDTPDEVLAVEGIDVFFVGPSDRSQSLGRPGQTGRPGIREAIHETFAAIVGHGK